MPSWAVPRSSRWVRLGLIAALALALLVLTTGVVGAQAVPPEAKSEQGSEIRNLYFVVFGIAVGVFFLVEGLIFFVFIRYRRRDDALPEQIHGSNKAELIWTVIPFVIMVGLFIGSFVVLESVNARAEEGEPVEVIDVVGRQWTWAFAYAAPLDAETTASLSNDPRVTELGVSNGAEFRPFMTIRLDQEHLRVRAINGNTLTVERAVDGTVPQGHSAGEPVVRVFIVSETLIEDRLQRDGEELRRTPVVVVPVGRTIRFNIASVDVLHAFYTPQFLYKIDAVPGRINTMWVKVTEAGIYESQCAEFCGRDHARMLFTVDARPQDEYDAWLAENTPPVADASAAAEEGQASEQAAAQTAAVGGNATRGQELFFANGCNICHGDVGQGAIGPTIASTGFTLDQVIAQYRSPRAAMPPFPADRVPDADIADIYAWLQTLALPDQIVPGEGTPQ